MYTTHLLSALVRLVNKTLHERGRKAQVLPRSRRAVPAPQETKPTAGPIPVPPQSPDISSSGLARKRKPLRNGVKAASPAAHGGCRSRRFDWCPGGRGRSKHNGAGLLNHPDDISLQQFHSAQDVLLRDRYNAVNGEVLHDLVLHQGRQRLLQVRARRSVRPSSTRGGGTPVAFISVAGSHVTPAQ